MPGDHDLPKGEDPNESPDTESLLSEDQPSEKLLLRPPELKRTRRNRHIKTWLHVFAILLYITATIGLYTWSVRLRRMHKCECEIGKVSSPAQVAVEYEQKTIIHELEHSHSKYRGKPSPEIDAAWDELLRYNNLRVYKDELEAANMTSVPLSDGKGGYFATLDVYHTLHCVNRARKSLYPDYYTSPNLPEIDRNHTEHCIDLLRQVIMCYGDVALHTYQWRDDTPVPWPTMHTTHQCKKWDRIVEWSKTRDIGELKGPKLQHPTLGISYNGQQPKPHKGTGA